MAPEPRQVQFRKVELGLKTYEGFSRLQALTATHPESILTTEGKRPYETSWRLSD